MPNSTAIDRLIEEYAPLVYSVARGSFQEHCTDPDLLQCGMIGLWEAAEQWRGPPRPFAPFARTCILHNMVDYMRKRRRWGGPLEDNSKNSAVEIEENTIDRIDLDRKIANAFPPNSRERFVLIALSNGASKPAIAVALGVQVATVTRIAKSAYKALKAPQD